MKLTSVDYSLHYNTAKYTYHFDNGIKVVRCYVSPFTRINAEVFAIKIPFFNQYLFANELLAILISVAMVLKSISLFAALKTGFSFAEIALPVIFLLLYPVCTWAFCTTGLSNFFLYLKGNDVEGIVVGSEKYRDSEYYTKFRYSLKLPNEEVVVMDGFSEHCEPGSISLDLKIHPDNIPYVAKASSSYFWGQVLFWTGFYLIIFLVH